MTFTIRYLSLRYLHLEGADYIQYVNNKSFDSFKSRLALLFSLSLELLMYFGLRQEFLLDSLKNRMSLPTDVETACDFGIEFYNDVS